MEENCATNTQHKNIQKTRKILLGFQSSVGFFVTIQFPLSPPAGVVCVFHHVSTLMVVVCDDRKGISVLAHSIYTIVVYTICIVAAIFTVKAAVVLSLPHRRP
jgi:hypothetical protein